MNFHKFREANFYKFLVIILFLVLVLPNLLVFAQLTPQEEKQQLEKELKELEEKIAQYAKDITKTEQEKKTLKNQIYILKNKIEKLELEIRQSNAIIKELKLEITDTEGSIEKTVSEIENSKKNLAIILRTIYKEDQKSDLEILLSGEKISDYFNHLVNLQVLNLRNQEILGNIETSKASLENQKKSLAEDKDDLERIVQVQTLQRQESEATTKEQERILKMTEAQYQQYLKEKKELEKKVAEIMTRIAQLTLAGMEVPTTPKELYELASWTGKLTGVRPALILGLIEVESALGINVGQCNCAGQPVCRHPELSYKQVMSPNQWAAFEAITRELGLNPNTTPVSCYVGGGTVQWGGAMGPAQFMPNTWLNLGYKKRVEEKTGIKPANPWRTSDAFLAAALYLADFNASTKNRESEMGAVTAYLCGTSTMTTRCINAGGKWYRDVVMEKADKWQEWINAGL